MLEKLIINLTPTGVIPTKDMTPHVPVTADEIVADVKRCVAAGVNMLHLHAREASGRSTYEKEVYARIIGGIREAHPDLVIGVSLSGRHFTELGQRADVLDLRGDLRPDFGSLTLSSMNFQRTASVNTPEMIHALASRMADAGIRPELEVFDLGMINYATYLSRKKVLRPPFYFNLLLGNIASAQARPGHLAQLVADLPPESYFTVAGLGEAQLAMNALGILFGNGVRVGLEDNVWFDQARTRLATNEDLVTRVVAMAATFEKPIASHREVRDALGVTPLG